MPEAKQLLNHGLIRLVESMGSDLSIVRAARTSYAADWRAGEDEGSDARLINYLVKNHHTSPFEAVTLTFEVHLPLFVRSQWQRHRTQSYSEMSGRYTELPEVYYVPEISQITSQSVANKQQRTDQVLPDAEKIQALIAESCSDSFAMYKALLKLGCARELARGVLPMNTFTKMFATGNLLNWMKFIQLRNHSHAQHEIKVYAEEALEAIRTVVPVATAAFEKHWINKE